MGSWERVTQEVGGKDGDRRSVTWGLEGPGALPFLYRAREGCVVEGKPPGVRR